MECVGNEPAVNVHADGMSLHDGSMAIDVDDESGKVVAFAMNETVGIVLRVVDQSDAATHINGCTKSATIEISIYRLVVESKYTDHDASDLEMSGTDIFAFRVSDLDDFALFRLAVVVVDGSGEYPRMETVEGFFFTSF